MKTIYKKGRSFYGSLVALVFLQFLFHTAHAQLFSKAGDKEPGHHVLSYARDLQQHSQYAAARIQYQKYVDLNSQVGSDQRNKWYVSCDSAQRWMMTPDKGQLRNESVFNSNQSDWGAVSYNGGMVFSSNRSFLPDDKGRKIKSFSKSNISLYELKKGAAKVSPFPVSVERGDDMASASFSSDGKELYFTLTRLPDKSTHKRSMSPVNIEIHSISKDESGNWSALVPFKYNKPDQYSVGDPFLSKDGHVLYFVSNMLGGKGGTDIYYCKKMNDGTWGMPVNAAGLNTEGNERSPFSDDSGEFYFSSDGFTGMGGLDIFKAKINDGQFSCVKNMGYPINSPQDDFSFYMTKEGQGYFSSNRLEGMGKEEIYSFDFDKTAKVLSGL